VKKVPLRIQISLLLCTALGGCMVGPKYHAPENTVSNEWEGLKTEAPFISEEAPLTAWWKVFADPLLEKYIELAAAYNKDIQVAEANILLARALRKMAASSLFPQINADVNATKTYFSKNGPVFAIGPATGNTADTTSTVTGLPFSLQVPQIQNLYNVLFDATWEIDLFGKNRHSVEAADATIGSAIEHRNDVLISVLAEIAKNYMEVRSLQQSAMLVEENIQLLEETADIIEQSMQSGLANQLNYEEVHVELSTARSELPDLIAQVYRGIYSLSILTGSVPEALMEEVLPFQPLPDIPDQIAVGLRSDLLRRRPDVRQAERELASATANVGVATASFYPTITLFGEGGLQSLNIKNLFTARSKTWALGGDMAIPVFQGGNLVGNLKAMEASASVVAYTYQQTVLHALQEAESTLKSYEQDLAKSFQLTDAAARNYILFLLTDERNQRGLVSLLDVIASQRKLIASEKLLLDSDTTALLDLVALYKALGGGWEPQAND